MSPAKDQAALQQALQYHRSNRWPQALALYKQLCERNPRHFEAHQFGGGVALQLGRVEEAAPLLRRAAALDARALLPRVWLASAEMQRGAYAAAESALRQALELPGAGAECWSQLGAMLTYQGRTDEALAAYQKALQLNPGSASVRYELGTVLQLQGQFEQAVEHHSRALTLEANHPHARRSLAQALLSLHRVDACIEAFDLQRRLHPDDLQAASLRLAALNYSARFTARQLFEEHRNFGILAAAAAARNGPARRWVAVDPGKRLRLAFLSPDLRSHSVAFFLEPLLAHLDSREFEILLYHNHPRVDAVSERLKTHATLWRQFVGLPDDAVERTVLADAPDVLIDLAGHTGLNRASLIARRIAPVQITYLGYPNTSGLTEMDYRFTDAIADPVGESDLLHSEQLVRFAPTAWSYAPPAGCPDPAPFPCTLGQPFTFGSFNILTKVNDETLALWSEALGAVPGSRLLIKSVTLDEVPLRKRADALGIGPDRLLILQPTFTITEHLDCYRHLDVALDPTPYHGTTTTCEALWMGVPVLSLQGDRHASRVGGSLLHAVGRAEWAVQCRSGFGAAALRLAEQCRGRPGPRNELRSAMAASPLLDHAAQAARFGTAVRRCWVERCERPAKASKQPVLNHR